MLFNKTTWLEGIIDEETLAGMRSCPLHPGTFRGRIGDGVEA
jgi:hypothetical protein